MNLSAEVEKWLGGYLARFHTVLEEVCEQAIQGGKHGVLVIRDHRSLDHWSFTVTVSPEVPYGEIWERSL